METGRFLFVAEPGLRGAAFRRRLERLLSFYEPLGVTAGSCSLQETAAAVVGGIGVTVEVGPLLWWLEPPANGGIGDASELVRATDLRLRQTLRTGVLIGATATRCRIVAAPCGPVSSYEAGVAGRRVWATHAVVAAYLANGVAEVDPAALPELLALGHLGADRSLLRGVRPVPAGTSVDLRPDGAEVRSWWPLSQRWLGVDPAGAHEVAGDALLRSLRARCSVHAAPRLGLTGGLDSRVVAVAARRLDLPIRTFTWGHAAADAQEAARVAGLLGLGHDVLAPQWLDDEAGLRALDAEARWTEGLGRLNAFGTESWPDPISAFVTGGAGEVGRAFHWRLLARTFADPSLDQVASVFRPERTVPHLGRDLRAALRERVRTLLEHAAAGGLDGWGVLDVFYAEHRLAVWGRGVVPRRAESLVAAFADAQVLQALAALPTEAKVADGFHRRFLREHAPAELHPPGPPPLQRSRAPRIARRLAADVRSARSRPEDGRWPWAGLVASRPLYRQWLQALFDDPIVLDAFGADWASTAASALSRDAAWAGEAALGLSGPVALGRAVRELAP